MSTAGLLSRDQGAAAVHAWQNTTGGGVAGDAGPPVDGVYLAAWLAVSVATFMIFGVLRPASMNVDVPELPPNGAPLYRQRGRRPQDNVVAGNDIDSPIERHDREQRFYLWIVRQLFASIWAWLCVDLVHRVVAYVYLAPTMLWRRHMLPLSQGTALGFSEWVNSARLLVHCGELRHGDSYTPLQYFLLGGMVRDIMDMVSSQDSWDAELAGWALSCQEKFHWKLPVSRLDPDRATSVMKERYEKLRQFTSPDQRDEEVGHYHFTAVVATLIVMVATISVFRIVVGCLSVATKCGDPQRRGTVGSQHTTATERQRAVDEDGKSEEEAGSSITEEHNANASTVAAAPVVFNKDVSAMTRTVQECWPVLLNCVYAGAFAYVGGMPIMMRYMFPSMAIVSSVLAVCLTA